MTCKIIRCDWIVALLLLSVSAACSGERAPKNRNEPILELDTFQDPFQKYKLKPKETYLAIRDSVSREKNRIWAQYQSADNETGTRSLQSSEEIGFGNSETETDAVQVLVNPIASMTVSVIVVKPMGAVNGSMKKLTPPQSSLEPPSMEIGSSTAKHSPEPRVTIKS